MKLYSSISSLCSNYSIPLSDDTIGYLQFFQEFDTIHQTNVTTINYYVIDTITGIETPITPLNAVVQYLGDFKFRMLLQGFHDLPNLDFFRFKIEVNFADGSRTTLFSDLFSFVRCDVSFPIIPCLVETQEYSINENYINEISGNIVYQSWHTAVPKKYTPVVFLRNVSFNRKTNTIEFKKLNNKPLKTTLKRTYSFRSEPISATYIDDIDEIFGFGKVNLLGTTYVFDSYGIETLDEKDCCSLYKINATAYEENNLRLQCSNNCVVLNPVDCDDLTTTTKTIEIEVCKKDLVNGLLNLDVTQYLIDNTGYDINELVTMVSTSGGACLDFDVNGEIITLIQNTNLLQDESNLNCFNASIEYEICGQTFTFTIKLILLQEVASIIQTVTYTTGYTINTVVNSDVQVQYSTDNINWTTLPTIYPIGTTSIFTTDIPQGTQYIRLISYCNDIPSNVYDSSNVCNSMYLNSVTATVNIQGGGCNLINLSFHFTGWQIGDPTEIYQWDENNSGETFIIDACIDLTTLTYNCQGRVNFSWNDSIDCCP